MFAVFVLVILALLAKDATPLGDRYVLRALSEGVALLAGCAWLLTTRFHWFAARHAVLGLYIGVLLIAIPLAVHSFYVALQVFALVGIVLFSLAYLDRATKDRHLTDYAARTMLVALTVVCLASLATRHWHPEYAHEQTFEGLRFRGLFSKPAMMAAAAGLLVGLALFARRESRTARLIALAAAVPCLFFTGSRTFWAAALGSVCLTALRYMRWSRVSLVAGVLVIAMGISAGIAADLRVTTWKQAGILRQDSIDTFSGRTAMWAQALHRYWERPWLGHGFTSGGLVLEEGTLRRTGVASSQLSSQGAVTLHNGYVQALLDSGGIGAVLYVGVIAVALGCFLRYDRAKQYAAEFYCLLFLAIANFGETVIFGAAVLHGVWFWYLTVLALTLPSLSSGRSQPGYPVGRNHVRQSQAEDRRDRLGMQVPAPRGFSLVPPRKAWS
jgi:hypothetical protein